MIQAAGERFVVSLTTRQAQALRALARLDELTPEVYAEEVLVKHLYHAYTAEVARRAADLPSPLGDEGDDADRR